MKDTLKRAIRAIKKNLFSIMLLIMVVLFCTEMMQEGQLQMGMVLQLLFCTVLFLISEKGNALKKVKPWLWDALFAVTGPLYIIFAIHREYGITPEYLVYTYCVVLFTGMAMCVAFGTVRGGTRANAIIYTVLLVANEVVLQFRKNFFFPADILSLKTALSVGGAYARSFKLTYSLISALIALCIFIKAVGTVTQKRKNSWKRNWLNRLVFLTMAVVAAMGLEITTPAEYISGQFLTIQKSEESGYIAVFSLELRAMSHEAPDGYEKENAQTFLTGDLEQSADDGPNVIIIMDEAFSDLTLVGELETNRDFMPFIRELQKEHQSGTVYVPSWSANTCNTEWEVLTGNSIAFCLGTIPYTQFISSEKYSMASHLTDAGYVTLAIHPYYATGYRRDKVYPFLGFDDFASIEDMDPRYTQMEFDSRLEEIELQSNSEWYVRDLISDEASFGEIICSYEEMRYDKKKVFIFNLTMQNHAPYDYQDYEGKITADLGEGHPDQTFVNQYLSLIAETDSAFENLIRHFSQEEEDTIILLLGDHQPGMGPALYNHLYGYDWDYTDWSAEEERSRYKIPYVLWANFDYELSHDYSELSSNYISLLVMDAAGMDQSKWYDFMHEAYARYPVIHGEGVMDAAGNWQVFSERLVQSDDVLRQYRYLQYYRMFDE